MDVWFCMKVGSALGLDTELGDAAGASGDVIVAGSALNASSISIEGRRFSPPLPFLGSSIDAIMNNGD